MRMRMRMCMRYLLQAFGLIHTYSSNPVAHHNCLPLINSLIIVLYSPVFISKWVLGIQSTHILDTESSMYILWSGFIRPLAFPSSAYDIVCLAKRVIDMQPQYYIM